jgi:shikimate dehydrogenase
VKHIYLLGYPLGHSISPAMQNATLRACGLDDWRYEKMALPADRLPAMVAALRADDCAGANVTIPHKQAIISQLDGLSDMARAIGAVNTIIKREGRLIGENTDAPGFMQALQAHHVEPRDARVYLFGAGGAAAAVGYALAGAGARQIVIVNRTPAHAQELAERLQSLFPQLGLMINHWESLNRANLIVNASALGMAPAEMNSPLPRNRALPRGAVVFDLVYNPPATQFLEDARSMGAQCIGGLDMLVYQGARAFELWTGQQAPLSVMHAAARQALEPQPGQAR